MIRKATEGDVPALLALQKGVESEKAIWGYGADLVETWAQRDLSWTWVALAGTEVLGFAYCLPRPADGECVFPPNSKVLEILDLIVARPHRGRGIGRQLVATVEREVRTEGFTHLRLYSAAKRLDEILRFYRRCGFVPWYLEMTKEIELGHSKNGKVPRPD